MNSGTIFKIKRYAIHDGPGIRTTLFFKGCPLDCRWCHSPESQAFEPDLVFIADRCVLCGACAAACPHDAHAVDGRRHIIMREKCRMCRSCVEACPTGALAMKGFTARAGEIVRRARRMKPFFRHTGGGVTLTGGEPGAQPRFAEAVLAGCREHGIHTALETSGAVEGAPFAALVRLADLILYDLKIMDSRMHARWTGAGNERIVDNLLRIDPARVQVRVPLIPGVSDTAENLAAIFAFCAEHGLCSVALLPYNGATAAKYEWLGLQYTLPGAPQTPEQIEAICAMPQARGLTLSVV